jgi:addiction module HigA family antidote
METSLPPVHPGKVLLEEAMSPIGLSAGELASRLGIPPARVLEIVGGDRAITADTALRLARFFGMSAQFWMNLQASYDLKIAERTRGAEISRTVTPRVPAKSATQKPLALQIDFTAMAGYVRYRTLDRGEHVAWTQRISDDVLVDFDAESQIIGIELLSFDDDVLAIAQRYAHANSLDFPELLTP